MFNESKDAEGPDDDELPVVEGVTETQPDTEPMHLRLAGFLAKRPGGSTQGIIAVTEQLERLFMSEANEDLKCRLAGARAMLLGEKDKDY